MTVFDLSHTRILNRREHAEDETKKKVLAFEERLNEYQKEVDSFRKKEVRTSFLKSRKLSTYWKSE